MGKDDGCRSGRHGGEDRKSARLELGGPDAPGVRYLGDYVMGTGARVGARRRRVLELPTLRKLLRQLPSLNFGPANHDRQPRHGTLDPDE